MINFDILTSLISHEANGSLTLCCNICLTIVKLFIVMGSRVSHSLCRINLQILCFHWCMVCLWKRITMFPTYSINIDRIQRHVPEWYCTDSENRSALGNGRNLSVNSRAACANLLPGQSWGGWKWPWSMMCFPMVALEVSLGFWRHMCCALQIYFLKYIEGLVINDMISMS